MRVNPARAGMILAIRKNIALTTRKPRASGDYPDIRTGEIWLDR